jgi:CheY-like chemotaxis protein
MKSVLLIDDSQPDHFLHNYLLQKSEQFGEIDSVLNVEQAINLLVDREDSGKGMPDIILLDINMPRINGWEFLDFAANTTKFSLVKSDIYMLTTSLNPDDKLKAIEHYKLAGFFNKPLTEDQIEILF